MNDNPYMNDVSRGAGFTMGGFLLGAMFGAGIALLLAPATGGETRRKVGETAKRLANAASERFGRGGEEDMESSDVNRPARPTQSREPLAGTRTPRTTGPGAQPA